MRQATIVVLGFAASLFAAPPTGSAQGADVDSERTRVAQEVDAASVIRIRTSRFEASLKGAQVSGTNLTYADGEIRAGEPEGGRLPAEIPFSDLVQVDVFRPHTALAAVVGAGAGYAIAAVAIQRQEREMLEECTRPFATTPCYFLDDGTKRKIKLGTAIVFVPLAIYTDRMRFAWRTVYRKGAF